MNRSENLWSYSLFDRITFWNDEKSYQLLRKEWKWKQTKNERMDIDENKNKS